MTEPFIPDFSHRLMSSDPEKRVGAAHDVWDYGRQESWHADIWSLIEDFACAKVRDEFLKNSPAYLVSDNLSWLTSIVSTIHGCEIDFKDVLGRRLAQRYRAIRASHGTSTTSLVPLYTNGLRTLDIEEFQHKARMFFRGGQFPELSESDLSAAIERVDPQFRRGLVFFQLNERFLIEHCGHYMLYGSEYLSAIAASLGSSVATYRNALKGLGKPTLFVCDVPLRHINPAMLDELAGNALAAVFEELRLGERYAASPWEDTGISILTHLDPANIVGHYHSTVTRDPFGPP